jgi:hypothetical protein
MEAVPDEGLKQGFPTGFFEFNCWRNEVTARLQSVPKPPLKHFIL